MANKFLTLTGLQYFWDKVKGKLDVKVDQGRKINGKDLTADITLTAADVNAVDLTAVGAASGVASLDASGKVPSAQLPSYVDDVLEFENREAFPEAGESGKIYITTDTSQTYRWGGTAYVEISSSLALGETESTAGRGDWTKAAYDHSLATHAPADAQKNVQADWTETDETSDAYIKNKPTEIKANGGNADTVGGFTVETNVPADAKFTDTVYEHPEYDVQPEGLYKFSVDATGHVNGVVVATKEDIAALGVSVDGKSYDPATTENDGLMSATDKTKLDGIEEGANKYTLPTASTELGGVKTTSEIANTTGYSACPIVDGVVYYKDQVAPDEITTDDIDAIFA